jgi:hypothetical protein
MELKLATRYKDKKPNSYLIGATAGEFRYIDGALRFWKEEKFGEGYLNSIDRDVCGIFRNSCLCDGYFFADIKLGETYTGSDGTTLTFANDSEKVETPAGVFENCQLWLTKLTNWEGKSTSESYYKEGVGIVKYRHISNGFSDVRLLYTYHIEGGNGLLPMAVGNTWAYTAEYAPDVMKAELTFKVSYADEKRLIITSWMNLERLKYDENSWLDMIEQIRNDYWEETNGIQKLCDVSKAALRAEALAKTPMEKVHTRAAVSVSRRIMNTDPTFNPNHTATGHWNFFSRNNILKTNDVINISHNQRWSFEWKNTGGMGNAGTPEFYRMQQIASGLKSGESVHLL